MSPITFRADSHRNSGEREYIVTYDIADRRRWRRVHRLLKGYGDWIQLSVFHCRLGPKRHAELIGRLEKAIDTETDRVIVAAVDGSVDERRPDSQFGLPRNPGLKLLVF